MYINNFFIMLSFYFLICICYALPFIVVESKILTNKYSVISGVVTAILACTILAPITAVLHTKSLADKALTNNLNKEDIN